MATLCNCAGHYIFALWFLFLFFLTWSQRSEIGCLLYFHTWCGLSANIECRSEMCCTWLVENTGCKKSPSGHVPITQLYRAISSQLRHVSTIGKNLLSSNISSSCPYNMVNLWPTSGWDRFVSLGHPYKFQRVSCLGSVTARHSCIGRQPNCGVQQRAPPIFGRAAITLGIGPHF